MLELESTIILCQLNKEYSQHVFYTHIQNKNITHGSMDRVTGMGQKTKAHQQIARLPFALYRKYRAIRINKKKEFKK